MNQPTLFDHVPASVLERDRGIKKSSDHAERVNDGWNERAWELLRDWVMVLKGCDFTTENFRYYAEGRIPQPPDPRAFASIIVRAKKEGLIEFSHMGFSNNKQAHRRPVNVWRVKQ